MKQGLIVVVIFAATLAGCAHAPMVTVDGFEVAEAEYQETRADVVRRAAFDLECDPDSLEVTVLDAMDWGAARHRQPTQYGVAGCGRRAVYVYMFAGGTWVMNSESGAPAQ